MRHVTRDAGIESSLEAEAEVVREPSGLVGSAGVEDAGDEGAITVVTGSEEEVTIMST